MSSRVLRRAFVALALSGAVSACAAIWGFQDAIDLRDGGAGSDFDATSTASSAASSAGTPPNDGAQELDGAADAGLGIETGAPIACPGACVATPPSGWSGPVEFFETTLSDGSAGLPTCGAQQPWVRALDLEGLLFAPPAVCTCSCGPSAGATCKQPVANYFSDPMCLTACNSVAATTIDAGCTALTGAGSGCGGIHAAFSATVADAGSCGADASTTVPPVSWEVAARICEPLPEIATAFCEAGTCAPARDSLFQPTYCIVYPGIAPCPQSDYPVRRTYDDAGQPFFAGVSDTRSCSPCECGPPTGVTCGVDASTTVIEVGGTCSGLSAAPACVQTVPQTFVTAAAVPSGGQCAVVPDAGQPVGVAIPTGAYTVCCNQ